MVALPSGAIAGIVSWRWIREGSRRVQLDKRGARMEEYVLFPRKKKHFVIIKRKFTQPDIEISV